MKKLAVLPLAAALLSCASSTTAQSYPSRTVRIIVPYAPGGIVDIFARSLGQRLAETMGQQFIVDNVAGANGIIGTETASRAAKDGHTLLMVAVNHVINPSMYRKLNYDPVRDFAAISIVGSTPYVLSVHPSIPARDLKELLALARARPGQLSYASTGAGSPTQLSAELMKSMSGVDMLHVPYKGAPQALSALLSGETALSFLIITSAIPHAKSGKLRMLGISTAQRVKLAPEVPTLAESGLPGYEMNGWIGLLAPQGVPAEILSRLNAETRKVLALPDVRDRLTNLGVEVLGSTSEDFAKAMRDDVVKWAKVVAASGAKPE
jgi:tripartite-type tricarboxylate transporter receptor subunit TctC